MKKGLQMAELRLHHTHGREPASVKARLFCTKRMQILGIFRRQLLVMVTGPAPCKNPEPTSQTRTKLLEGSGKSLGNNVQVLWHYDSLIPNYWNKIFSDATLSIHCKCLLGHVLRCGCLQYSANIKSSLKIVLRHKCISCVM